MRFGVIRVRRDHRFELLLRLGDLAGVPENDALVVQRVGTAAAATRRRRRQLAAFLPASAASSNFRCAGVDVREAVVRLGVIRLDFDRLLVRLFGLVEVLLAGVRDADVVVAVGAVAGWSSAPP